MKINSKETLIEEYKVLEQRKQYLRDCIDGLLNRASVTDNENERHLVLSHINNYIKHYIEVCEQAHKIYKEMIKELENDK